MIKRLTNRNESGIAYTKIPANPSNMIDVGECYTGRIIDRLAAYEDTGLSPEEITVLKTSEKICEDCWNYALVQKDGRLVALPCKVGDTVYTVDLDCRDNPDQSKMCFCWNKSCKDCDKAYLRVWENHTKTADVRSIVSEMGLCGEKGGFGKTVFLTREAAEKALGGGEDA